MLLDSCQGCQPGVRFYMVVARVLLCSCIMFQVVNSVLLSGFSGISGSCLCVVVGCLLWTFRCFNRKKNVIFKIKKIKKRERTCTRGMGRDIVCHTWWRQCSCLWWRIRHVWLIEIEGCISCYSAEQPKSFLKQRNEMFFIIFQIITSQSS